MSALKIAGKDARSLAKPARRPPAMTDQLAADLARWGDPNADPFVVDTTQPAALRASFVADCAVLLDQAVHELAALARKRDRLRCKLSDPRLADNPHRDDAIARARALDADIAEAVATICWDEAHADRVWQGLTVPERDATNAPFFWNVEPDAARLVGRAWLGFGAGCRWPYDWSVRREWIVHLPFTLQIDLRIAGVFAWRPNPRRPLFDDARSEPMPLELVQQLFDEKGNLR